MAITTVVLPYNCDIYLQNSDAWFIGYVKVQRYKFGTLDLSSKFKKKTFEIRGYFVILVLIRDHYFELDLVAEIKRTAEKRWAKLWWPAHSPKNRPTIRLFRVYYYIDYSCRRIYAELALPSLGDIQPANQWSCRLYRLLSGVFRISKRRGPDFRWPLVITQRGPNYVFQFFPMVKFFLPKGP